MKYKNIRTGEIRDFACTISGNMWEPVEAPTIPAKETPKKPAKKTIKK